MAANHHNALEAPTTTAVWDEDRLTLYDACMGVRATQLTVAHRRALTLLAGAAKGMSEGLILALGFKSELIADLIDAELVTASKEYMGRGSSPVERSRA